MKGRPRVVIGWSELVDFPLWGIEGLGAKIDTGARTSALHVEKLQPVARNRVRFDVILHRAKRDRRVHVVAPVTRRGRVRASTGHYMMRTFVTTHVRIGPVEREIEISLVDREKMIFRMLLGRSALEDLFLIDPTHRRLLTGD